MYMEIMHSRLRYMKGVKHIHVHSHMLPAHTSVDSHGPTHMLHVHDVILAISLIHRCLTFNKRKSCIRMLYANSWCTDDNLFYLSASRCQVLDQASIQNGTPVNKHNKCQLYLETFHT
ncbi:hypothetical protein BGX38DRAFT_261946 [Terfezia claveryi]|nr:hypothetical protein BGX38DRAFT_261946 [Terfezia claveryi]